MVGFRGVRLAKVATHNDIAYASDAAIALPWAGKMNMTPKEAKQDLYYDDMQYVAYNDLKGYDVELRVAQVDFNTLETLGAGTFDAITNTFNETMSVSGGEYRLGFIVDNPDHLPFYIVFRSFMIASIKPDSFVSSRETITPNEMIITGAIGDVLTVGLSYKSTMKLLPDKSNLAGCNAFISAAEVFPGYC